MTRQEIIENLEKLKEKISNNDDTKLVNETIDLLKQDGQILEEYYGMLQSI